MKKINKKRLQKRINGNEAESNTIAVIFIIVFLLMVTITILDASIYFLNRNVISNAATNGARLASIYGGTGGKDGTPISKTYGKGVDSKTCKNSRNPVNCAVEDELKNSNLIGVELGGGKVSSSNAIQCGPNNTTKIGERTYCEITWTYGGLPGSAMSFIKRNPVNITKLSAESEVIYNAK